MTILQIFTLLGCFVFTYNIEATPASLLPDASLNTDKAGQVITPRKVDPLRRKAFSLLAKISAASQKQRYEKVAKYIEKGLTSQKFNTHEKAKFILYSLNLPQVKANPEKTASIYQQILDKKSSIPLPLELMALSGLNKTQYKMGNVAQALKGHINWLQRANTATRDIGDTIFMSQLLFLEGHLQQSQNLISSAIKTAKTDPAVFARPSWFDFVFLTTLHLGQRDKGITALKERMQRWPQQTEEACQKLSSLNAQNVNLKPGSTCSFIELAMSTSQVQLEKQLDYFFTDPGGLGNPLPIVRPQPRYPRKAIGKGITGYATIALTVNKDGSVDQDSIRVVASSPEGVFNKSAIQAATKFVYKPYIKDGKPVPVENVTYKFTWEIAN